MAEITTTEAAVADSEVTEHHEIPADPPAFDREGLESRTAETLASVFKDGDEELDDSTPAETPATTEEKAAEETPAAETTETTETEEDKIAAAKAGQAPPLTPSTADPAIPAAYARSLKAYGWTDEEISRAAKVDPQNFLKTAERIHVNRNEETRRMSDLGRQIKAQESQQAATRTKPAATPTEFKPIDVAGLKAKYGDEPFIQQLEQMNGLIGYVNQVAPWIQASQQRAAAAELETLGKQVDGFFSAKEMEPYFEHYGKFGAKLTDAQAQTRQQVLETADLLISGARAMGRSLALEEALTLAHDSVSGPIREKVAVQKVHRAVQARQQSMTLRPGARAASSQSQDRKALEGTVKAGLSKVFS